MYSATCSVRVRPDLSYELLFYISVTSSYLLRFLQFLPTHRSLKNVSSFFYFNLTLAVRLGMIEFAAKHDRAKFLLRGVSCR